MKYSNLLSYAFNELHNLVDPEEFCGSKLDYLKLLSVRLVEEQPRRQREDDAYITISGFQNICQRAARMLDQAQYRIYMTGTAAMLELFREKLEDLGCLIAGHHAF